MLTQLQSDMKDAMRARDKQRRDTIRLIIAEVKKERIAKGSDLEEKDFIALLSREAKKRREAIDGFRKGGREEQAQKEEAELAVIKTYLPEELSEDKVKEMIAGIIAEVGAASPKDMGKVMGKLSGQIKGRFDGKAASGLVRAALQAL